MCALQLRYVLPDLRTYPTWVVNRMASGYLLAY